VPKRCSVCEHEQRVEIDFRLLSGELTRAVSERIDGLTYPQIKGHRRSGHHLQQTPRRGITSSHTAAGLLKKIVDRLDDAEALADLRIAVGTLPHEQRGLLVAELRRRAGKVEEPVLTRVEAAA
jgi:hypothetical protein